MAVIEELIRQEDNGTISFGNHLMDEKKKVLDFEGSGDLYKIKSFREITKLERNGKMRILVDTNILFSALVFPCSKPSRALLYIADNHEIVLCDRNIAELRIFSDGKRQSISRMPKCCWQRCPMS